MKDANKPRQAIEPVEQEEVPFKDHTITAVRLDDGRIAVVLRWICQVLNVDPNAQNQRIERTESLANEFVYVKVQPRQAGSRGGGAQPMYAITLRGFSPWILGINPSEVKNEDSEKAERIRALIRAYQEEAKDVLYEHFVNRRRIALLPERAAIVPSEPLVKPQEPESEANDHILTCYYEDLAVWALWKARQHAQQWRGQVQGQLESLQDQLESEKAVTDLIPEILERLGPETITPAHQGQVRGYVKQLHELTSKPYPTIYDEIRLAFGPARYQDLLEVDWTQIENWFEVQIDRAKRK